MRIIPVAAALGLFVSSQVSAGDAPSKEPPIESDPVCKWSKAPQGEWICDGKFKLARGQGDPLRVGHCGTVFKAGTVIVTALEVKMASKEDPASPFYLIDLYLNRKEPAVTVIGGTFRSERERKDDVYCFFRAQIKVQ
jgi:hypothetical protein